MPISGPGGPTGARGVVPTSPTSSTDGAAPAKDVQAPAAPQGWSATGAAPRRSGSPASGGPVSLGVPAPPPELPNPVQQAVLKSVDQYTRTVQTTLHHDALSLARGQTPVREGDPLSAEQQTALKNASVDLVKSLPLGALAPDVAASVQERLEAAGLHPKDLASTRLADLGKTGGDVARELVEQLKQSTPGAYYGLAAGLATAAGYVAWSKGSDQLSKLGIKPEAKQKFFNDQLQVQLKGDWQAHFKDFKATGTVSGNVDLGQAGKLTGEVVADSKNGLDSAKVGYALTRPNWNLSASAAFDGNGLTQAQLDAAYTSGAFSAKGTAAMDKDGFKSARVDADYKAGALDASAYATANRSGAELVGGRFSYKPSDDFALSGSVDHNLQTGRTTAGAEATWKVKDNVDFALSARHDSAGDSYVGAGLTVRF